MQSSQRSLEQPESARLQLAIGVQVRVEVAAQTIGDEPLVTLPIVVQKVHVLVFKDVNRLGATRESRTQVSNLDHFGHIRDVLGMAMSEQGLGGLVVLRPGFGDVSAHAPGIALTVGAAVAGRTPASRQHVGSLGCSVGSDDN
jgi:hypothetical protein